MNRILFSIFFLFLAQSVSAQTTWINHITGGSDNLYGIGVYTNSQWTAVGTNGAIWQTSNSGANWTYQNSTTQMPLHDVVCVSGASAFAVGDSGIILKTSNSGNTWTRQTSGTYMPIQSVFFRTSQIGYACGWAGNVFSTVNSGATWNVQTVSLTANFNDITFVSSATGYCVGWAGVIYKTIDGGVNWTPQVSGVNINLNEVHFTDSLNGYCAGGSGTLLKTINGGLSWSQVPSFTADVLESLYFITPLLGFCGTDGGNIFVSTDGGNNWLLLPSNSIAVNEIEWVNNQKCVAACNMGYVQESTYLDWAGAVNTSYCDFMEFVNDSVGFAVSSVNNQFLKTTDAGNTWNVCYIPPNTGFTDIDFVSDSIGYVAAALWLYKTTDQGATWTAIPQPYGTYNIDFITEDIGFGDYGSLMRTLDGGISWLPLGDYHGVRPFFFDIDSGYAMSSSGLRFTSNGGNTWTTHAVPVPLHDMFVLNKNIVYIWNNGYAANDTSKLFRTFDAGNTFVQIVLPYQGDPDYALEDAYFTDSLTGYIAMDYTSPFYDLFIFKTIDGGITWSLQGIEYGTSGWTSFEFANKNLGFCASAIGIMRNVNSDPPVGIPDPPYNYNIIIRQPAPPYAWIMQPGDSGFQNMADSKDAKFAGVDIDFSGKVVFSGSFIDKCQVGSIIMDSPFNGEGFFVGRCSEDKSIIWVNPFFVTSAGSAPLVLTSFSTNLLNEILVAGTFSGSINAGNYTLTSTNPGNFLVKMDSTGAVLWAMAFTPNVGIATHYFYAELDSFGNMYMTGNYSGNMVVMQTIQLNGYGHCFVGKISMNFVLLWLIQSTDNLDTRGVSCTPTSDGNIIVCGRFNNSCKFGTTTVSTGDSNDIFLAKFYGGNGALLWLVRASGMGNDIPTDLAVDIADNIYLVGTYEHRCWFDSTYLVTANVGVPAIFYAKYNTQGDFVWVHEMEGTTNPSIAVSAQGNCFITGVIDRPTMFADTAIVPIGFNEIFVFKTNLSGELEWIRRMGGSVSQSWQMQSASEVMISPNDDCYLTGYVWGYNIDSTGTYAQSTGTLNNYAYYGYLAKIGYGQMVSGVEDTLAAKQELDVFPVPADGYVHCNLPIAPPDDYKLMFYDISGRLVYEQRGDRSGRNYISTENLSVGVYTIKVNVGDFYFASPIILTR